MAFIYVCTVMNTVFLQNNVFYSINNIVFYFILLYWLSFELLEM